MVDSKLSEIQNKLEQFVSAERIKRIDEVLSERTTSLTVVLDDVRSAHNISAVLRSADTFGLVDVHLVGDAPFEYSKGVSVGSERWMRIHHHASHTEALNYLKSNGFEIAVLQPESISVRYNKQGISVCDLPFNKRLALVFGNEQSGISEAFLNAADHFAHIQMLGFAESLNISVACAICLFLSTLRQTTPEKRTQGLPDSSREELRKSWLVNSIPQGEKVLREIEERLDGGGFEGHKGQSEILQPK